MVSKELFYTMLSQKLSKITASATFAMKAKAQELKRQGKSIVSLTIGEPDFDVPEHIKLAAKKAIDDGFNKYTDTGGLYELKEAIVRKFKRDNNIEYQINEIMATAGGKQALYNIFQAILNPGDEVILPEPFWVSYVEQIKLADGLPVVINTIPNNFKLTADLVEKAISPRTKALVLCSPSNPTGTVVDNQEIQKIAQLAIKHNFYVVSDEVYEFLYFTNHKPLSIASLSKEICDLTLTVNAVSKTFSMTGWRLGFVGANAVIIKLMDNLQSHTTSNPNIIAQKAAIEGLNGDLKCVHGMRDAFKIRRDFLEKEMKKIANFSFAPMDGSFYAFINVGYYYNEKINNSDEFCLDLLAKTGLALTPGSAFGPSCDNFVRMSYASKMEELEEGMKRLREYLKI